MSYGRFGLCLFKPASRQNCSGYPYPHPVGARGPVHLVGAEGFEPPTLCSQSRCATRLRYAPKFTPARNACGHRGAECTPSPEYGQTAVGGAISCQREAFQALLLCFTAQLNRYIICPPIYTV